MNPPSAPVRDPAELLDIEMNEFTRAVSRDAANHPAGRPVHLCQPVHAMGPWPDWMGEWEIQFAETSDRAKKCVASSTLGRVDWNAELVRGDVGQAVQQLKQEPGEGLWVGGVTLPRVVRSGTDRRTSSWCSQPPTQRRCGRNF